MTTPAQEIKAYAYRALHTDAIPYEVIRTVSATTVEIRELDATLAPTFKPNVAPGGFAGHTTNNRDQSYTYESNDGNDTVRIRWSKRNRRWQDGNGNRYAMSDTPFKFHDYNF